MILYFSGTGNTRPAADRLARLTGDQAVPIDFDAASMPLQGRRDRIVWCFPTYSWGPPPVVADFISRVRLEAGGIPAAARNASSPPAAGRPPAPSPWPCPTPTCS